jgi:hypothetical protein
LCILPTGKSTILADSMVIGKRFPPSEHWRSSGDNPRGETDHRIL